MGPRARRSGGEERGCSGGGRRSSRPWSVPPLVLGVLLLAALAGLRPAAADAALFCRDPVSRAVWTQEPQGARLKVFPSGCGRRTAWVSPGSAFRRALAAGGRPAEHRRSLYDQFRCHTVFAPFKRSWNLETWRPVVSPERMVRARCNPNGRPSRTRTLPHGAPGLFATVLAVVAGQA